MLTKIFNISLVTKILKKLDLYAYSVLKLLYIKDILMKIDVFNKKEKVFIKYMEILENVRNIIKNKFNSELIYISLNLIGLKAYSL